MKKKFRKDTGTLGIPRSEMPQFKSEHHGALTRFLNGKGIDHTTTTVNPKHLKPTQAEYDVDKVEAFRKSKGGRAVIATHDGHVIDGHHQWLAAKKDKKPLKTIVLHTDIEDALRTAKNFPSLHRDDGGKVDKQKRSTEEPVMREYRPSVQERIASSMMGDTRPSPERRRFAEGMADLAYYMPGVGEAIAGDKIGRSAATGDYLTTLRNVIGVIPGSGKFLSNKLPTPHPAPMKKGGEAKRLADKITDPEHFSNLINRHEPRTLPMRMPYGQRYDEKAGSLSSPQSKDIGFFGPLKNREGSIVSEYSAARDGMQYPSVYQGMSPADRGAVLMHERMTEPKYQGEDIISERLNKAQPRLDFPQDVDQRAYETAKHRVEEGRSPFFELGKDPYPAWSPDQNWEQPAVMRGAGGEIIKKALKAVSRADTPLGKAAQGLGGDTTREMYQALVNEHKPVRTYESVPTPATIDDLQRALHSNKREKIGMGANIPEGAPVGLRLDIPAYTEHGVWAPTIHDTANNNRVLAHEPAARVMNPTFVLPENKALKVAQGAAKSPFATINGAWAPTSVEDIHASAQEYLNHPDWRQVGMDPERHGYFYDRATQEPITHAEEALQVGPLVLAKNPVYGNREDFKYAGGGEVNSRIDKNPEWRMSLQDGGDAERFRSYETHRLTPMERIKDVFSRTFGPRQEWQDTKDQIRQSGMLTPNPKGRPYTEAVSDLKTMMGYPAIGQPFTYHRLNDLPMGKGQWKQTAPNVREYTPDSWKDFRTQPGYNPDKYKINSRYNEGIDKFVRTEMGGATPREAPTPTTPRQATNTPFNGAIPANSTRFMEMSIPQQSKLQAANALSPKVAMQNFDTGITGRPVSPGAGNTGVAASDSIIPGAHTPRSAQRVWDQSSYGATGDKRSLAPSEMTSQGSTSMLGHGNYYDPKVEDPNDPNIRAQRNAEMEKILNDLESKGGMPTTGPARPMPEDGPTSAPPAPEGTSGPALPPPPSQQTAPAPEAPAHAPETPPPAEGGIGQDQSPDINMPSMAHGGMVERDHLEEGGVPNEGGQQQFLQEQLKGSAPQYVEQHDFPSYVEMSRAEAGPVSDALRIAARYSDPASHYINNWAWRPLQEVQREVGTTKVPEHVQNFGHYMNQISDKAATEGLDPEDAIKAYMITRSSIQREGRTPQKLASYGIPVRQTDESIIRPEGHMADFLTSPTGVKFLNQARKGELSQDVVDAAQAHMKPFGMSSTEPNAMDWARRNLPEQTKTISDLVARARTGDSTPEAWRGFTAGVKGIGPAKAGFLGSLLGRGDLPTLDARQAILHTGLKNAEAQKIMQQKSGKAGHEAVDRLAARQRAMNFELPEELQPYYQHLAHHTVWDTIGNERTTHQDIIDAMRPRADGGQVISDALRLAKGGGAWTRAEGKSEKGGLNAKGRASLKAQGHDIKPPQPEGGPRRDSFCARMKGMKKKLTSSETANDPNSRINKSLRVWNCHADGGPVWDNPRPKGLGKPHSLSDSQKSKAKAAAKAAGRPYPNLVDNMNAAKKK